MNDTPTDDHEAYSKWLHKHMTKKGRATGQIDSLMESGTGLLLFEVWEGAKDECKRELTTVTEQRDGLRSGIDYASDQLTAVTEQRDSLAEVIRLTLMENLHLADGDQCTLKCLKDAIGFDLDSIENANMEAPNL